MVPDEENACPFVLVALLAFGCAGTNAPPCSNTLPPGVISLNHDAVYVANTASSSISAFSLGGNGEGFAPVCGSAFQMPGPPTGLGGGDSAPSSAINDLIVLSSPQKAVWLFKLDFIFGNLTGPVASVTSNYTPVAVAVWQNYFYVANAEGNLSAYQLSSDGTTVTELQGSPFPTGSGPVAVAASEPGLLYVANSQSNNIAGYTLDPNTGVPTPIPGSPFPAGSGPSSIEVAPPVYPSGFGPTLVIVSNMSSNDVSVYAVGGAGGLTPVPGSPFAAGAAPSSSATGNYLPLKYVYVANSQSNDISGYSIDDTTGTLTALAGSPSPTGVLPLPVAVSSGGMFLYVANDGSNTLSAYSIDHSTGALTPVSGSPFAVGQSPTAVWFFQVPQ